MHYCASSGGKIKANIIVISVPQVCNYINFLIIRLNDKQKLCWTKLQLVFRPVFVAIKRVPICAKRIKRKKEKAKRGEIKRSKYIQFFSFLIGLIRPR